jgi:hypothetical protein
VIGKDSARLVKARPGERYVLDTIVAQLDLVEIADVGDDRVGGFLRQLGAR